MIILTQFLLFGRVQRSSPSAHWGTITLQDWDNSKILEGVNRKKLYKWSYLIISRPSSTPTSITNWGHQGKPTFHREPTKTTRSQVSLLLSLFEKCFPNPESVNRRLRINGIYFVAALESDNPIDYQRNRKFTISNSNKSSIFHLLSKLFKSGLFEKNISCSLLSKSYAVHAFICNLCIFGSSLREKIRVK